ncbi:methionine-S-sulfoxide reductase [Hypnocyclicus thermotrophus]|uniref:peptide-methionine (S)-S-oxide reductase n=1 Tax=Hypnocyclicus thermotrophus TaxID=1627895 RepID=A0AA46DZI8_9FUSO|nr:peptide-methionine (S)-S-oxide reductase MsrA [Hypnocyclicus thermotrophus]TDT71815.1 methionine-S-sulfoxide reductase [Hypnocyclicus thermotrophus]
MYKLSYYLLIFIILFNPSYSKTQQAIFAGGCFWCMEPPFEKINGVKEVYSGFTGGNEKNPSYKDVANGKTGHREAILVLFDNEKVSYNKLLDIFWSQINPTDPDGQFVDRGFQYSTAIFYLNEEQKKWRKFLKKILNN